VAKILRATVSAMSAGQSRSQIWSVASRIE
jgi:hypothetical protein